MNSFKELRLVILWPQYSFSSIVHYNNTSHLPLYSVLQKQLKFTSFRYHHRNNYLMFSETNLNHIGDLFENNGKMRSWED